VSVIVRTILVTALVCGCARPDWIERTLVTVDVTGIWEGSASTDRARVWLQLDLVQEGSRVKGVARRALGPTTPEISGTVAGDMFTFRGVQDTNFFGEMTVNGEEMSGRVSIPYYSWLSTSVLVLRRVGPPSSPRQ
jgi:hypothetical protein